LRGPATISGDTAASISSMSAFVRETPKAPTFEARFVFFVVPANTKA